MTTEGNEKVMETEAQEKQYPDHPTDVEIPPAAQAGILKNKIVHQL